MKFIRVETVIKRVLQKKDSNNMIHNEQQLQHILNNKRFSHVVRRRRCWKIRNVVDFQSKRLSFSPLSLSLTVNWRLSME